MHPIKKIAWEMAIASIVCAILACITDIITENERIWMVYLAIVILAFVGTTFLLVACSISKELRQSLKPNKKDWIPIFLMAVSIIFLSVGHMGYIS